MATEAPKGLNLVNRTRHEIAADILELTQRSARITRIVHGCNLCHGMTQRYLDRLIEDGLIRRFGKPPAYETTDKGRDYLAYFRRAQQLLY